MAQSAKDIQLREQKDLNQELKQMIQMLKEMNETMKQENAELRQTLSKMQETIDYLTKKLYGASSEKREEDPEQLHLFNEAESFQDSELLKAEKIEKYEEKPRKKRITNSQRFKGVPVEKVYLDIADEQKICSICGSELEKIGEEFVRREVDFVPAKVKIKEYYSISYGCPRCKEENEEAVIVKGKDGRGHELYGMATAGTIAWTMYQKYANALPLYRQEKDWKQYGLDISRATLSNWIIKNAQAYLLPMYEYLHRSLLQSKYVMADETPLQVLHEDERRAQTKSYMWVFLNGEHSPAPIHLYKYSTTRAGDTAVDFLEDYTGYIMCDGYTGYNKLKKAKRTSCWAHIRRYLIDAVPKGKQHDYTLPSVQGLLYVQRLFALEDAIQKKYKGKFDAIKEARLKEEKPVIEGFLAWVDAQNAVKGTRFASALTYIRNRRDTLMTYLEDGRCSFTNNASERVVKDFVIGRKNWLFSDSPAGADASAVIYSIVATAKANGVNIYHYLKYLLEEIPTTTFSDEEFEALVPWNPVVKQEIDRRAIEG